MTSSPRIGASGSLLYAWLGVLALLAAVVSGLLAGGARPATQAQGLIAFTRHDGIYVMRPDGRGVRPLLRTGGVSSSVTALEWSPDGGRLAFAGWGTDGIWTMKADGTGLARVAAPTAEEYASPSLTWSPDGQQIAYPGRDRIWVVNAAGGGQRQLLTIPFRLYAGSDLDWSHDGKRFAFTTGGYFSSLYVVDADGSNLRLLAGSEPGTYAGEEAWKPEWSPNGRWIAFTREREAKAARIFLADPKGGSLVRLTPTKALFDDIQPSWSQDGAQIAFVRGESGGCFYCPAVKRSSREIYVINATGKGLTRLTHNRLDEQNPAWQPVAAP